MKKVNFETLIVLAVVAVPICIGTVNARMPKKVDAKAIKTTTECSSEEIETETFTEEEILHQVSKPSETAAEEATEAVTEPQLISLGIFKVTAYCSCSLCCSHYAENRPLDENGAPIVYGASGEELVANYSIAVDTDLLPFGEIVLINDREYICHDRGSAIVDKRIDIFMESHEKALQWGVQNIEVFKVINIE